MNDRLTHSLVPTLRVGTLPSPLRGASNTAAVEQLWGRLSSLPFFGICPYPASAASWKACPTVGETAFRSVVTVAVAFVALVWIVVAGSPAGAAEYEPGTPYTYLFDTNAAAQEPLSPTAIREKKGWTALAEDDVTHQFAGDAVLLNDRLAVVLRMKASGAELYAQSAVGQAFQPAITPILATGNKGSLKNIRIVENTPGAVMVEAGFQASDGPVAKLALRLTTGQTIVELRPGEGVAKIRIQAPSRYVAVPDFFGDDMVFRADGFSGARLGLPAENFLLHFVDGGNGLLMCVWPSSRQQAAALLSGQGPQRTIQGSEIQCLPGKSLWIAALVGPAIWHERAVDSAEVPRETVLDWKPPFPAKWRASLTGTSGIGPSWYFRGADDAGESIGQASGPSPCCLEAQRAVVQFQPGMLGKTPRSETRSLVVYPIDRSRTTPLTTFCPIDILRATLGVGPCQYILQTEGLASDANPTPDSVMTWVEKQFSKKKEKKAADEIRDMLLQMTNHVEHVQKRIAQYGELARDVRRLCEGHAAGSGAARASQSLRPTLDRLDEAVGAVSGAAQPVDHVRKLVGEVAALIGQQNAAAECQRLGLEIRRLGASQDRTLANCRMAARWIRQQTAMWPAQSQDTAGLAEKVLARIGLVLGSK